MDFLIATTNKGKLKEIQHMFADSHFTIHTLADIKPIDEPIEDAGTVEGNAMIKAGYYAEHSGMLTLADDSGLFIPALNNWPGAEVAYVCDGTDADKRACILEKMNGITDRSAYWLQASVLFDPQKETYFISRGRTNGRITTEDHTDKGIHTYGYNGIFKVDGTDKTYAEMPLEEKNAHSHRGKALFGIQTHLSNTYGKKTWVVPLGIIIRNGKILMNKRHEPHLPKFHDKWEFPGGGIDFGETPDQALVREVKEETGFEVVIEKAHFHIQTETRQDTRGNIQLYLLPYICRIVGGKHEFPTNEVSASRWFDPEEVASMDLIGNNAELYSHIKPVILDYIKNQKN